MPRNPIDPTDPAERTLHNCPPSFWRDCVGCGKSVRSQDVRQGWHFRAIGRTVVRCGPVSQDARATGGTPSLVERYQGEGY